MIVLLQPKCGAAYTHEVPTRVARSGVLVLPASQQDATWQADRMVPGRRYRATGKSIVWLTSCGVGMLPIWAEQ